MNLIILLAIVLLILTLFLIDFKLSRTDRNKMVSQITETFPEKYISRRPWIRFFARVLDVYIFGFFIGLIIGLLSINSEIFKNNVILSGLFLLFIWIFIESAFLHLFKATPGKLILNIQVWRNNKKRLSYWTALKRSYLVWFRGMGAGIPFVWLFTCISGYSALTTKGITSWDVDTDSIVLQKKIGYARGSFAILLFIFLFYLTNVHPIIANDSNIPNTDINSQNSLSKAETELSKYSIYSSIKERYPEQYEKFLTELNSNKNSLSSDEIFLVTMNFVNTFFMYELQAASHESIDTYLSSQISLYEYIFSKDPGLVFMLEFNIDGAASRYSLLKNTYSDVQFYASKLLKSKESVIKEGYAKSKVSQNEDEGAKLLLKVLENLSENHSRDDVYATFITPAELSSARVGSEIVIEFYEAILNLNSSEKEILMRYIGYSWFK